MGILGQLHPNLLLSALRATLSTGEPDLQREWNVCDPGVGPSSGPRWPQ